MLNKIKNFVAEEDGVTAVEYAVLAVLIIAAVAAAMVSFEGALTAAFDAIGVKLLNPSA